jgi:exodeoxyribonuclease-1
LFERAQRRNAHDALADVEATIFLARKLAEAAPAFWASAMMRSSKSGVSSVLATDTPVLVFEHITGQPSAWFGQQINSNGVPSGDAIIARLGFDWSSAFSKDSEEALAIIRDTPGIVRNFRLNKAPVIFSAEEAELLFSLKPSLAELQQSITLRGRPDFWAKAGVEPPDNAVKNSGGELEQRIYEGFPSRDDQHLMAEFQRSKVGLAEISEKFEDQRLRLLAKRIVFVSTPEVLSPGEAERIEQGISIRRNGVAGKKVPWRTIGDAEDELRSLYDDPSYSIKRLRAIGEWLDQMKSLEPPSKLPAPTPT